jgi:hypothetical protein
LFKPQTDPDRIDANGRLTPLESLKLLDFKMEHRKGSEVPDTLDTHFQITQLVISNIIYAISSFEFKNIAITVAISLTPKGVLALV